MALKALRDKKRPRILWIDALCINQSDIEERSSQVAFMSSVYSRAVRVIVWLGESGKDIAKLFDFLNDTKGKWRQAYCRIPQQRLLVTHLIFWIEEEVHNMPEKYTQSHQ